MIKGSSGLIKRSGFKTHQPCFITPSLVRPELGKINITANPLHLRKIKTLFGSTTYYSTVIFLR